MSDPENQNELRLQSGDAPTSSQSRSAQRSANDTARPSDSVPAGNASLGAGRFSQLPARFGRYEVRKELGRGQMGAVYLALDLELDRPVALKLARVTATGATKLLQRMKVEAKAAAKIDHPLICKVYDAGEIDDIRYIALQYVEGEDLRKWMKRAGRRTEPDRAIRLIRQMLGALQAAHEKGIMHRDLKPENVMLNKNDEPVIMDFGLARNISASPDAGITQGMIVGTAAYMAPEQAKGQAEEIDERSDLYSVGVMLFEMLTGQWPFDGAAIEIMGKKCVQDPPSPLSVNPKIDPQLAYTCQKMIAREKEDRYRSCAKAREALESVKLGVLGDLEVYFGSDDDETDSDAELTSTAGSSSRQSSRKSGEHDYDGLNFAPSNRKRAAVKKRAYPDPLIWIGLGFAIVFGSMLTAAYSLNGPFFLMPSRTQAQIAQVDAPDSKPLRIRIIKPDPVVPKQAAPSNESLSSKPPQATALPVAKPVNPAPVTEVADAKKKELASNPSASDSSSMPAEKENTTSISMADEGEPEPVIDPKDPTKPDLNQLISNAAAKIETAKQLKGKEGYAAFKEAVKTLKQASLFYPKDLRPDFYLGILHSGIGVNDSDVAEMHFKRVLERSPGHVAAMNNLGLVGIKGRKFQLARNYLGLAASTSPRPIEVNQNVGRILNQAKLLEIKKDDLKRIAAIDADPSKYSQEKGWFYMPLDGSSEYKLFTRDGDLEDESCSVCEGFGSVPCRLCGRSGSVLMAGSATGTYNSLYGTVSITSPTATPVACSNCGGRGRIDCKNCNNGIDPTLNQASKRR